ALLDSIEVVSPRRAYAARVHRFREDIRFYVANKLVVQESYDRAVPLLESLDSALLGDEKAVMRDNSLAWCLAHTGQTDRAVDIARNTIARASDSLRPFCHGTLGVALVLARRPQEGMAELEVALKTGEDNAEAQCIRAFYFGEALRGLGRIDEAVAAYEWA